MLDRENVKKQVLEMLGAIGVDLEENNDEHIVVELDSLQFISLICDLEEKYGIRFTEEELIMGKYESLNMFIDVVVAKIVETENNSNQLE